MNKIIFSKSFIDYINKCDNKICTYLKEYIKYNTYLDYFTPENINYITFRKDGTISYLPNGKEHIVEDNNSEIWKMTNRQNAKSSSAIRKIITKEGLKNFNDKDFENFTNCYKKEFNEDNLEFKLLKNKEVFNVYNHNIIEGDCNLQGSCMNGNNCFDIYTNCKDLRILALYNENDKLCGRALIWNITDGDNNFTLMDRIYVGKEFYTELFIEYARNNKWWRKEKQSYDYKNTFINNNEELVSKYFTIYLNTDFRSYPYIDTFTYGEDDFISNRDYGYTYTYTNTDKTRSGDNNSSNGYDDVNECDIDEDDVAYIDRGGYSGQNTYRGNIAMVNGYTYYYTDALICNINGTYYLKDDCIYDDIYEEWVKENDAICIEKGEYKDQYTHYHNTIKCNNGFDWYKDDDDIININNIYYDKNNEEDIIEINGDYYLTDSEEALEYLKETENI